MKKLALAKRCVFITIALTQIVGCSALSVGEENFSCSGMPGVTMCGSASQVYERTEGEYQPSPAKLLVEEDGETKVIPLNNDEKVNISSGYDEKVTSSNIKIPIKDDVTPIRTPAEVMRIWVAPWEDTNGNLHVTGLVYTEVEKRRWTIGGKHNARDSNIVHKNADNARDKDKLL